MKAKVENKKIEIMKNENERKELLNELKDFEKNVNKKLTRFGEIQYNWDNYFHPDNPEFMQKVFWLGWQKTNGKFLIGYKLGSNGKMKFVKFGEGDIEDEIPKYGGIF